MVEKTITCTRCKHSVSIKIVGGKGSLPKTWGIVRSQPFSSTKQKRADLCPKCLKAYDRFVAGR